MITPHALECVVDRLARVRDITPHALYGFAGGQAKNSDDQGDTGHVGTSLMLVVRDQTSGPCEGGQGWCIRPEMR